MPTPSESSRLDPQSPRLLLDLFRSEGIDIPEAQAAIFNRVLEQMDAQAAHGTLRKVALPDTPLHPGKPYLYWQYAETPVRRPVKVRVWRFNKELSEGGALPSEISSKIIILDGQLSGTSLPYDDLAEFLQQPCYDRVVAATLARVGPVHLFRAAERARKFPRRFWLPQAEQARNAQELIDQQMLRLAGLMQQTGQEGAQELDERTWSRLEHRLSGLLRQRYAAREQTMFDDFERALNPVLVQGLKDSRAYDGYFYERLYQSSPPTPSRRLLPSSPEAAAKIRNRAQFGLGAPANRPAGKAIGYPLFMHLALSRMQSQRKSREEPMMESFWRIVDQGRPVMGKGEEVTQAMRIFARMLGDAYNRSRPLNAPALVLELPQHLHALRALLKLDLRVLGDGPTNWIVQSLPVLLAHPPAKWPKTPMGWGFLHLYNMEEEVRKFAGNGLQTAPSLDVFAEQFNRSWAEIQKNIGGPDRPPRRDEILAAVRNTRDYLEQAFNALVVPAALAQSGLKGEAATSHWAFNPQSRMYQQVYARFAAFYSPRQLLELSLRFHQPHFLPHLLNETQLLAYQSEAFERAQGGPLSRAADGTPLPGDRPRDWYPLVPSFTFPYGFHIAGVDVGGIRVESLTNAQMLRQEGNDNKNCVGGYTHRCSFNRTHILRITRPLTEAEVVYYRDNPLRAEVARTTLEILEKEKQWTGGEDFTTEVSISQHMRSDNVPVTRASRDGAVAVWLQQQINEGQRERAARLKMQNPDPPLPTQHAMLTPRGLPDFVSIDFDAIEARRGLFRLRRGFASIFDVCGFDPWHDVSRDGVLTLWRDRFRLLPPPLRDVPNGAEILRRLGVSADTQNLLELPALPPALSRAPQRPDAARGGAVANALPPPPPAGVGG